MPCSSFWGESRLVEKVKAPEPFNPLNKRHLAENVAKTLLESPLSLLPPNEPFVGAGIYAIHYGGGFEHYRPLVQSRHPIIYVGKAIPPGSRKGGFGLGADPGQVLYKRLREHTEAIKQVPNLKISDFGCQCLVTAISRSDVSWAHPPHQSAGSYGGDHAGSSVVAGNRAAAR